MPDAARHLVVGRLRKPPGLKGDVALFPLTDRPEEVFRAGQALWLLDLAGEVVGGPLEVERARAYHREWLLKFRGLETRSALDAMPVLRDAFLGAPVDALPERTDDDVPYVHELEGWAVRTEAGAPLGVVSAVYDMPAGLMLEVQGPKREFLLPLRDEFARLEQEARVVVATPPDGLLD